MFITRNWSPNYLARGYFAQTETWITAKGEVVKLADMRLDHVANSLLMLERVADDLPFDADELQSQPLYKALYERLMSALDKSPDAEPSVFPRASLEPHPWHSGPRAIQSCLGAALPTAGRPAKRVTLDYEDAMGERSQRLVEPLSVQNDLLVARDLGKAALRTFRIDRIERLRLASGD